MSSRRKSVYRPRWSPTPRRLRGSSGCCRISRLCFRSCSRKRASSSWPGSPLSRGRAEVQTGSMIIDIYTHILPDAFFREMSRVSPKLENIGARLRGVKKLFDPDLRFAEMDTLGDYRQVISLPNPPLEEIAQGETAARLARVANDAMAELVDRHRNRFPAFVAAISLDDVDAALRETERAIKTLGAHGIQIFTNIAGHPLDEERFKPVFAAMAGYDLPIWLHPARTAAMPDYAAETKSRFEMWWCFGWPYETSVAMARLVRSEE